MPREIPLAAGALTSGEWEAIDDVAVWSVVEGVCPAMNEVPYEVRTRWQRVWVDVHEQVYSTATNAEQVTRALKWFTVVAQLLLRALRDCAGVGRRGRGGPA